MGFFNKIQNLSLPLIKLRIDCVSSYYVLLNVFHMILSNFTYRVFSPWGKNPAANRKLKKNNLFCLNVFINSNINSENRFAVFSLLVF